MYLYDRRNEKAIAGGIVGASVIVRKNEQSVNLGSLVMGFVFLVLVPWWWIDAVSAKNERAAERELLRATRVFELQYGTSTPVQVLSPLDAMNVARSTLEAGFTPTPSPTISPSPEPTASPTAIYSVNAVFRYSYYNPKLGGVNCYQWDSAIGDCVSMMANGEDWHNNYGKVVACAPEIALGTVIEVTYPDALKGLWVCKDRGGAIVGDWIDFLDIMKRHDWGGTVSATLYPPTVPLEQITKGSH